VKREGDEVVAMIALWVDDCILAARGLTPLEHLKEELAKEFAISDGGELQFFLGLHVFRDRAAKTLHIHQRSYIRNMLENFGMEQCAAVKTPQDVSVKLSKGMSPSTEEERAAVEKSSFQSLVGALLYASIAMGEVARFMADPGKQHWIAAKRVLRSELRHPIRWHNALGAAGILRR